MGVLDVILGRDKQGNASKINLALIALLLWRWYQNSGRAGGGEPAPSPRSEPRLPQDNPARIPTPSAGTEGDKDLGPLIESTRNMPTSRGGRRRGRPMDDEMDEEMDGPMQGGPGRRRRPRDDDMDEEMHEEMDGPMQGGPGGGLGDILGDILGGGRGAPGGRRGAPGGGLGDILGDILGGRRGMPGARVAGAQADPLGDLLRGAGIGGLGGLLAGGGGGALEDLMKQFELAGRGEAARSWVSRGQNIPVTPQDIEKTFGSDIINRLAEQFGMNKGELLKGLSEVMPETIDKLTPEGRLPTEQDISRWK